MIKRTIDISSESATRLRIEHDQLVIEREHAEAARVPCEDIGILLIDQQRIVYSHAVMTRLMEKGACVVFCGEDHLPCGLVLPLEGNELVTQRLRQQIDISRPLEKRLWQQIIKAKITAQAAVLAAAIEKYEHIGQTLPGFSREDLPQASTVRRLKNMTDEVQSGDTTNVEGQAARFYWEGLLGKGFKRARGGVWPNPILNYGYMVLRAAVARAIASAGLHPSFGIHHHNRGNAFCLADDLVEPLRPLVDAAVVGIMDSEDVQITPATKRQMLSLLTWEVVVGGQKGPLMVQLHRTVASVWAYYSGEEPNRLDLPIYEVDGLINGGLKTNA